MTVEDDMIARLTQERDAARVALDVLTAAVLIGDDKRAHSLALEHVNQEWMGPAATWASGVNPHQRAWTIAVSLPHQPLSVEDLPAFAAAKTYTCWVYGYLAASEFIFLAHGTIDGGTWAPHIYRQDNNLGVTLVPRENVQFTRLNLPLIAPPKELVGIFQQIHEAGHVHHEKKRGTLVELFTMAVRLHRTCHVRIP